MRMDPWAWFLVGAVIGGVVAWSALQARIAVWRSSANAWEEAAKLRDDEVKALQDELHPPPDTTRNFPL